MSRSIRTCVVLLVSFASIAGVARTARGEAPNAGESTSGDRDAGMTPADAGRSAGDARSPGDAGADAPSSPRRRDTSGTESLGERLRTRLVERYGLDASAWKTPKAIAEQIASLNAQRERLDELVATDRAEIERLRAQFEWSRRQSRDETLPEEARRALTRETALLRARSRLRAARRAGLERLRVSMEKDLERLKERHEHLERRAEQDEESRKQIEQAQKTEREARAALQEASVQQERARDRHIRRLIDRRSTYLSKIADLADERAQLIPRLKRERRDRAETFTGRRERLKSKLREVLAAKKPPREDREEIDQLFERLVDRRREARAAYAETRRRFERAEKNLKQLKREYRRAKEEFEEATARFERIGQTEVGEHRVSLAETKLKYRRLRYEKARDVLEARRKALEFHDERIGFFSSSIEKLLPHVGPDVRERFYSIWRNENWASARASLFEAGRDLRAWGTERVEQIRSLPYRLDSARLWGWIVGFLWRLALIPLVFYLVREYGRWPIRRGIDLLLHRPFFRRHAGGTIKLGEVLRTLIWPVSLYLVLHYNLLYVGRTFPEGMILDIVLNGAFVYWVGMEMVKLFALPRGVREEEAWAPAPDLGRLSDQQGHGLHDEDVVDLTGLETQEGWKLVRTVRHVLAFGVLAWVGPHLTAEATGHSLVWWLVDQIFTWGAVLIAYVELGSWRDEIASGFEHFAEHRMPRAVEFVRTHKDRFYGVLLMALVSVYLVVAETLVLGRRYLLDTEWSRRVANFLFRKKIELQQEEEERGEIVQETHDAIPEDYREVFAERPLFEENYLVEREELFEKVRRDARDWLAEHRKGTLALYGESGVGKTTLLNRLYREWRPGLDPSVCYAHLTDKLTEIPELRSFLADLFDLKEVPEDREAFVERLLQCEPRIVILDDCHHLFFRTIGGFRALSFFFNIVNLTDHRHYWLLTFNKFGWRYLQRVQEHKHFFGESLKVSPWSVDEIRSLIQRRNERMPHQISFTDLVITHEEERDDYYEVVQTANGYFRLLREFCQGNPRIALDFWLRNLVPQDDGTLKVSLFKKPSTEIIEELTDDHLFALTALAQHESLSAPEVAEIINAEPGFCKMALNYFEELELAERVPGSRRFRLTTFYFRPVIERLTKLNFLWN